MKENSDKQKNPCKEEETVQQSLYPELETENASNDPMTSPAYYSDQQMQQANSYGSSVQRYQYCQQTSSHQEYSQPYYEPFVQRGHWNDQQVHQPHYGWQMGHNPGYGQGFTGHGWRQPPGLPQYQNQGFMAFPHENPLYQPHVMPVPVMAENQQWQKHGWGKWRGRERGRGRGRGCLSRNSQEWHGKKSSSSKSKSKGQKHGRPHWKHGNRKSKQYVEKKEIKNKDENYSSSSDEDIAQLEHGMERLKIQKSLQETFNECLQPFFNQYNVGKQSRRNSIHYLTKKFADVKELDPLISALFGLEAQISNSSCLGFKAILKQILKKQYDIEAIKIGLQKKVQLKMKKALHDEEFFSKYPNPANIQFLQTGELQALDSEKTLFLIDGNNIMPKQKVFRQYFNSSKEKKKAEGQVRLAWLVYEARIKAEVFFDNKYEEKTYRNIKNYLFSQEEEEMITNEVPVYYADKHLSPDNTADQKIVDRLTEIVTNKLYEDYKIVLISADNILGQRCHQIFPIKKSSGSYIFKYLKQMVRNRNTGNRDLIKSIFKF